MSIRLVPLAVASLALGAVVFPVQAEVSVQKECGAEYQAAKAAGSLNGQSWQQFLQECRARHAAPSAAAAPAPAAEAPAAAPAAPTAAPAETHVSVQKECGSEYQAAKAAGSLGGQTWQQFLQACRARHGAAPAAAAPAAAAPAPAPVAAPAAPAPAPAAPTAAPAVAPAAPAKPAVAPAAEAPPGAATTKTGKPLSPGTQAFIEREKECGAEWRAKKAALLKANPRATWPAFLSACNKRLKAQGR